MRREGMKVRSAAWCAALGVMWSVGVGQAWAQDVPPAEPEAPTADVELAPPGEELAPAAPVVEAAPAVAPAPAAAPAVAPARPAAPQVAESMEARPAPQPGTRRVFAVEVDVMQVHAADASSKAIDDDGVFTGSSLGVAWAPLEGLPELRGVFMFQGLGGELEREDRFGGALNTSWSRQRFMLGLDAGADLLGFLRPSARVAAGYSLQQLELGSERMQDYTHDVALQGALGLEAFLDLSRLEGGDEEPWSKLRVGMRYQLGWSWQSAAQFDELRDRSDDRDTTWQVEDVNMGTLHTDGLFWTLGVNLAYAL